MRTSATVLRDSAERWGDRTALVQGERSWTYAQLDRAADGYAAHLLATGLAPGDRVTLFSENRWEWVAAYHGIARAGGVVNPVNAMLTTPEVTQIVQDCRPTALVGSGACLERALPAVAGLDSCRTVVSFDPVDPAGADGVVQVDLSSSLALPGLPVRSDDELFSIAYTSGTTGVPKGAMQSGTSVLLNWAYTASMHVRTGDDIVVTALPLPHVYGNAAVNSVLMVGGTVVLEQRFDAQRVLELVARHRATMVEGVPAMYSMLLDRLASQPTDFSSITRCTVGGQTISESVVERWEAATGAPLLELWGMTEISGLGTTHAAYAPTVRGSIGVALPGTDVRVATFADAAVEAADGDLGELMVRGPLVTMGYFGNDAATDELIEADGWLHTGDVARREGAHFFVVDRRKDMILTGGYNVYPAEIERVLSGHPDVALVGVGRVDDDRLGEVAHAFVVAADGVVPDVDQILAFAREHLAPYKIPKAVHVVPGIPTTTSGKIKRRELVVPAQEMSE